MAVILSHNATSPLDPDNHAEAKGRRWSTRGRLLRIAFLGGVRVTAITNNSHIYIICVSICISIYNICVYVYRMCIYICIWCIWYPTPPRSYIYWKWEATFLDREDGLASGSATTLNSFRSQQSPLYLWYKKELWNFKLDPFSPNGSPCSPVHLLPQS